ncbi:hypothetical protein ACIBKZ_09700 [Streptomyces sp. NPDC050421]|uniref:hypothetical protein n=1 Tax=Streptomyces sp. NPDC050421 TaxID=3365613 RepID=UPI0037BCFC5B
MSTNDQQPPATYVHVSRTTDTPAPATQAAPASSLQRTMLAAIQQYEREFAAANSSPTVATLLDLAQSYDRADTHTHREQLAAEVADEISLAEAGTIRRAAEAVKLAMPGIIARANLRCEDTATIARELGVTPSYVRRIIREQ